MSALTTFPTDGLSTYESARAEAFAMPLDRIDVSKPRLFQDDTVGFYFERLRRDAPVHYQTNAINGGFWSVTKYADIMHVDTHTAFIRQTGPRAAS